VLAGPGLGPRHQPVADDAWVMDSTAVECGRSKDTVRRSDLAGHVEYGYCASHSRYFWGLRLQLICTLHGLPVGFALAGAKPTSAKCCCGCWPPTPPWPPCCPGRHSSATRTTAATASRPRWPPQEPACCAQPQRRARPARRPVLQAPAPDHRISQRHLQRPARPRTPRRTHPQRRQRQNPAAHPRPHRRHLAQRQTGQPVMRSLIAYDHY
jgi:hypothetical protein